MHVVKNSSIYRTIPYTILKAQSFRTRLKGLMFRRKPLDEEGLWISPCNSIHMFFMHFPIDAIFLDNNQKIVHLIESLKPWRVVLPLNGAFSVLELPTGTIRKFQLEEGQHLNWL